VNDSRIVGLLVFLGLAVGSFLNVVIHRLPRGESLIWPASRCPACKAAIHWYDNVPVVGWILLGGRCRACRAPIALRYPLVEAVTAAVFVLHYAVFGWDLLLVPRIVFACVLIALFAIDLEHQLLPNAITLPGIVAGLAFSLVFEPGLRDAALGALLGFGSLWLIATAWELLRKQEAMGGGDLKMLSMVGAFLGWRGVAVTFMFSYVLGGLTALGLLLVGKVRLASKLPFGTFLAAAALIASLWGEAILTWYLSYYR
jgi:leader peptidase (prepilin peptidase)/N-methyltransferase